MSARTAGVNRNEEIASLSPNAYDDGEMKLCSVIKYNASLDG